MENNNRTILAIALIILLWSGYSLFFSPQTPPVDNTNLVKKSRRTACSNRKSQFTVGRHGAATDGFSQQSAR